ncbi:MAG: outer membrane lipoprotein-sorting protein [Spirochaetes bacterium]|jgi:outer membrane lipoprotein-sorting protein|nr:outer membrane lipoprotein-sorting protein [Spirochaetota bacterium]
MKKFNILASVTVILLFSILIAQNTPTAKSLLKSVDDNERYDSIKYTGEIIIEYKGKRFVKEFKAFAKGNENSFIEFTNSEDRETKYLKKDGRLYVYSPDTEQVMLISGHMLKESMMGSDLSYEDTIENERLSKRYTAELSGSEKTGGKDCWILDLTAIKKTESYPKQKLWVTKDNHELMKYELFALSGAKLKEYKLIRSKKIGNRMFPVESEIRDLLRKGSRTVFKLDNVVIDKPIPASTFSMRNLER